MLISRMYVKKRNITYNKQRLPFGELRVDFLFETGIL